MIDIYASVSWKYIGVAITSVLVSAVLSVYYIYIMGYCFLYIYVLPCYSRRVSVNCLG